MRYGRYQRFNLNLVWALIIANFVFFVGTIIYPGLIFLLGLRPAALGSQPWTIITNMFIHAGFWHILTNMLTLYFFGTYLTQLIGERKTALVYFGGGILGNVFFILLASPFDIAVGASGAIFSIGGALAAMRPNTKVLVFPIPVPVPLWGAVIGGFLILTVLPGIAWQAHLGGLLFGLVAGYYFRKKERRFYSF